MNGDLLPQCATDLYDGESPFADGTNLSRGTAYVTIPIDGLGRALPWYIPAESKAPTNWKDKWLTLRSRFERLIDECIAVQCVMVQSRLPSFGLKSEDQPSEVQGQRTMLLAGGGLISGAGWLFTPEYSPIKGMFPIMSAKGAPIVDEQGQPKALRFGAIRRFVVQAPLNWRPEFGSLPVPRLAELARDATNLLYQLPAEVAMSIWRNWLDGFSKSQNSGHSLWIDAIFELSWQSEAGSPLHSTRFAWVENSSFGLLGDGVFPRLPAWIIKNPKSSVPHEYGYPLAYYSKLADVVRASIAAIDEILERAELMKTPGKRFLVALSFPGEKRPFVHKVAEALSKVFGREKILYDDYLTADLARPDLDVYLGALYHDHSELLVPFFCAEYEKKEWCGLEWRQMRDILKRKESERIMPFRFDDAPLTGFLSIDGYVPIKTRTPVEVAQLIQQRIQLNMKALKSEAELSESQKSQASSSHDEVQKISPVDEVIDKSISKLPTPESSGKQSGKLHLARASIIKKLTELSHGQIEAVIATLNADGIPEATANNPTRAAKLVKWAEQAGGEGIEDIVSAARALGYQNFEPDSNPNT